MSTKQRIDQESRRDPDTLEREAEAARRDIAHTMDLLEERLSPGQMLDRALKMGREHGGEFASNLGRSFKYHPLPLLLTAVGISWLAFTENQPPQAGGGGGLSESARRLGEAAREKAESVSGGTQESAGSMRAGAGHAMESFRHQGTYMRERFEHTLHDQPLVLGALGLALGAILGGALPRSQYEEHTLGKYGERLREQAAGTAEAAKEAGTRTAEAARQAAAKTAREEASRH